MQHLSDAEGNVEGNVLHMFFYPVATHCKMLDGVGSSLKMVKFLLKHFLMLSDVLCIWQAPSQHVTTCHHQSKVNSCSLQTTTNY